ncbi:MAG: hypothetical protein ABIG20_01590 [archaeon]
MAKTQPAKSKPSLIKSPWIPGILIVVIFGIVIGSQAGFIKLPHIGGDLVWKLNDYPATIGVPYSLDFSHDMISSLDPQGNNGPYTFYLGSGVGFPPMGLILGIDGVLKGTPTGTGGNFQVCVKDVSGRSACRTYYLPVNSAADNNNNHVQPDACVTNARCGELNDPSKPASIDNPTVVGIYIVATCECPTGTVFHTDLGASKYCDCV